MSLLLYTYSVNRVIECRSCGRVDKRYCCILDGIGMKYICCECGIDESLWDTVNMYMEIYYDPIAYQIYNITSACNIVQQTCSNSVDKYHVYTSIINQFKLTKI